MILQSIQLINGEADSGYHAPSSSYSAPSYSAPSYSAPTYEAKEKVEHVHNHYYHNSPPPSKPSYRPPKPSYNPPPSYHAPAPTYHAPAPSYHPPTYDRYAPEYYGIDIKQDIQYTHYFSIDTLVYLDTFLTSFFKKTILIFDLNIFSLVRKIYSRKKNENVIVTYKSNCLSEFFLVLIFF